MIQKQKILLIEDDLYIREVYEEVLKEAGFLVESAIDGEEGLVKVQEGGYALILLDMMIPKLDGLGVLKALQKKTPKKKNGPIVLLTNLAHDPIIKEALALGAKSYIIKSDQDPEEIVAKVKGFIPE